jgi:hypothetical protein
MSFVGRLITKTYDFLFEVLQIQPQANFGQAFLFGIVAAAAVSAYPVLVWSIYSRDLHILFWLGQAPTYGLLAIPATCALMLILGPMVKCCRMRYRSTKRFCTTIWILAGIALLAIGFYVFVEVITVSNRLLKKCGDDPLSKELDDLWTRLDKFYEACDPQRRKTITSCKGYGKTFKNDDEFLTYLEDVELQFGCTGFCEFWAKPLFDKHSDSALRCATSLGQHLETLAVTVGVPVIVFGGAFLTVGICMGGYDHL